VSGGPRERNRFDGFIRRSWGWILAAAVLVGGLYVFRSLGERSAAQWTTPTLAASAWPAGGRLFFQSVGLAGCALVLAVLMAFPVAVQLGHRGGAVLAALVLVPLAFPPHLAAYVWRFALEDVAGAFAGGSTWWRGSGWSFFGSAWTLSAMYWPVVALPVALAMRARGRRLQEELATLADPRSVFWRAVVPGLFPGLVAGGGIFFLLALSNYGVPLTWNVPSQNVAVFARLAAFYSPGEAVVMAVPLQITVLVLSGLGLLWLSRRSYGLDLGAARCAGGGPSRQGLWWTAGPTGLVLLVTVALPLVAVTTAPETRSMLKVDLLAGGRPYFWGLVLSVLGATGALLLGSGLAVALRRARPAARVVVEMVGLSMLFVPAAAACLALAGALAGPGWLAAVYDSLGIFVLAYGLRYFYVPYKTVQVLQGLEGREHGDVERLLGLGFFARVRLSAWGLLRPGLAVSWLVVFALVLGELEMAGFLAQPGRQPVSVFLDNLMHYGRSASVAQWTLIVVATEVLIAWTVLSVGMRQWRKLQVGS